LFSPVTPTSAFGQIMIRPLLFLHLAKCILLFVYYLRSADYVSPQFLVCPAILKILYITLPVACISDPVINPMCPSACVFHLLQLQCVQLPWSPFLHIVV
jgi:hypothetical protein